MTDEKLSEAMKNIKCILNYKDDQPHYYKAGYERRKQKAVEQGQSTWTEAYHAYKAELNRKRTHTG